MTESLIVLYTIEESCYNFVVEPEVGEHLRSVQTLLYECVRMNLSTAVNRGVY